ncbi:TPA: N-6 DNA methylase [Vibrio parahaemolyticus]|nr:N-6 DNA methylase [Vibrio parahaemolyticus]
MSKLGSFYLINPSDWKCQSHGDVSLAKRRAEEWFAKNGTYEGAENVIEEFVRQWALNQLIVEYDYPEEWLNERLTIEEPVKMGTSAKQADIAIKNKNRRPFVYIETKRRNVSPNEFHEAERQLESYLASTHTATIGLVTDGNETRCVRKKIDPNDFEYIADIPQYGGSANVKIKLVRELLESDPTRVTGLQTITEKYERLLVECHNIVRDIDGLHDDEALDELAKVIYVKIFDERTTVEQDEGAEFVFQTYGFSNPSEAASIIRELYQDARNKEIEVYNQRIPGYERSRGVFKTPIKLSDVALYKIVEKLQSFSFIDSNADIKGAAFQSVLGSAIRAGMGQYFTPGPIVDLAVGIMKPTASDVILDPFCGSGHFLSRCLDYVVKNQGKHLDSYGLHQFKFFHLHGIEKSDRMVRIAMTDMMLHDDGHTNIRNLDSLLSFDNYPDIVALGLEKKNTPEVFSMILTNPPFGSIMRQEVMGMIGRFELGNKKKSLPLEILGLERCFQFLKPGGKLAIVLPDGLLKNKSSAFVRNWVKSVARVKAVISLPEEAFNPYGAMVKTSLCIFEKYAEGESYQSTDKAFLCELENIGFEATGRPKKGSEITSVIEDFHNSVGW